MFVFNLKTGNTFNKSDGSTDIVMTCFKKTSIANFYLIQSFCSCSQSVCMKYDPLSGSLYEEYPGDVENANKKWFSSGKTSLTVSSLTVWLASFRALDTGPVTSLPGKCVNNTYSTFEGIPNTIHQKIPIVHFFLFFSH